jgi:putative peptidoglycan lipid II flippase
VKEPQQHGLLRSAGVVSAAVAFSRITGMVREVVMARLFGAGAAYDAYLLGMRIPNLTRNLFAEGALSSAFVPVFSRYLTQSRREAAQLFNLVATALAIVVGIVCVVGMIFSPQLVDLLAPGFHQVPGKAELAVLLTRIMFPFLVLVAVAAQAMGALNACGVFGVPALTSACFNIGSLIVGLALGLTVGRRYEHGMIVAMAAGVVAGGAVQILWQVPSLYREGFRFRARFDLRHPGLREIGILMLPSFIGNAATQINVIVNTNFASRLVDPAGHILNGPVSWLGYAFRFLQLPLGLFGVAIASAALPAVSRSAALQRMDEFRDTLAHALGMVLLLTIPSSVGLAVMGQSMIGAVYQWGRFSAADTHQTALALAGYSVGLAGYSASKVLAPAFYALHDALSPMWVTVASIVLNFVAAYALVNGTALGHAGLALSTSLVALAGAAMLFVLLRARLGSLHGRRLAISALKISAAAALMGATCYFCSREVHAVVASAKAAQLVDVALSIPLGMAVFYGAGRLLDIEELQGVRNAVLHFVQECFPT